MEEHIQGLVDSVVNAKKNSLPDFTVDLPTTFVNSSYTDARKEWYRYVEYRKAVDLRHARNSYLWDHHSTEKLAEDFRIAYYMAHEEKKKFDKK
jgi:hypothetical protein